MVCCCGEADDEKDKIKKLELGMPERLPNNG